VHQASGRTPAGSPTGPSDTHLNMTVRGRRAGPLSFTTVTSGILALYFLVEAFEPFSAFRLVLGAATAALTVRLAARGTLVASAEGIKWHTMMTTRRWPYSAVSHFDLVVRSGERSASPRRVARIHLVDGRAQWLTGLEEPPYPSFELKLPWAARHEEGAAPDDLASKLDALNKVVGNSQQGRPQRAAG
jgi:hypothetical protein